MCKLEQETAEMDQRWLDIDMPTRRQLYHLIQRTERAIEDKNRILGMATVLMCFIVAVGFVAAMWFWPDVQGSPDDRLLEMTRWTIGTVLTVALALVGINWFNSAQSIEREERLIERRFVQQDERIAQGMANLTSKSALLEQDYRENVAEIDRRHAEISTIFSEITSNLSAHEAKIKQQIDETMDVMDHHMRSVAFSFWFTARQRSESALARYEHTNALVEISRGIRMFFMLNQEELLKSILPEVKAMLMSIYPDTHARSEAALLIQFSHSEYEEINQTIMSLSVDSMGVNGSYVASEFRDFLERSVLWTEEQ